jgi:D-tagatose-1,6-bisphosphate aldolase subunit GatZ/KbaZ
VQAAVDRLIGNLQQHAPPPNLLLLLSQFMPEQHREVAAGRLQADPLALIRHRVFERLAEYARASAHNRAQARGRNATSEALILSER